MSAAPLLPPEDLAQQLSTIEVLLSIYQGSSELLSLENEGASNDTGDIILTSESYSAIRNLAEFLSLPLNSLGKPHSVQLRDALPAIVQVGIRLNPLRGTLDEDQVDKSSNLQLILNVGFAIRRLHERKEGKMDEMMKPVWNLKQSDWMDRMMHDHLCTAGASVKWMNDESVDHIMNVIEAISEAAVEYKSTMKDTPVRTKGVTTEFSTSHTILEPTSSDLVLRSWYYLPSLSMKDKRKDLVSYAAEKRITGFVLAGKPGMVVLEYNISQGEAQATKELDKYWSDIKTGSWSDLASAHKKVSERHRELHVKRCFENMRDITSIEALGGVDVEEGGRIRTPDLDKLKIWLRQQGCIGQLDIVLGKDA